MLDDQQVLIELSGDASVMHGERLPTDIGRTLAAAGATLESVDLLAVIAGPGSFTGLRVGIAAMQGLAFARGLKIVPVSALEAIAAHARRHEAAGRPIAAWVDAHRGEVFAARYAGTPALEEAPATVASPEQTLHLQNAAGRAARIFFAGDGAMRYREVIAAALGDGAEIQSQPAPLAGEAGRIAAAHPERAVPPDAIVPINVRRPDAEIARDRERVR